MTSADPLRVVIAGIHHETNTFSPMKADMARFAASGISRGEEIVALLGESHHMVAGFLSACRDAHAEVEPLIYADVDPCGTISAEAFDRIVEEIMDGLGRCGAIDVVLLAMHGAAVSETYQDVEGELATRVRDMVGPNTTIAMGLDLHGNISNRSIEAVDVAVAYRENPHRDPAERAAECAQLAFEHASGRSRPVQCLLRLPMVVPILGGWTQAGPMRAVMEEAARIADEHSLLSFSVFHGFGYADVPEMGSSVLAIADGDKESAQRAAQKLAQALWDRREDLRGAALTPAAAIEAVRDTGRVGGPPIILLDVGDNIGGGSPGDSTVLLAEALERRLGGLVASICDDVAAQQAIAAGEGAEVELSLGRKTTASVGPVVHVRGRVTHVSDGRFEDATQTHGGYRFFDGGPTVRLSMDAGNELLITSVPVASRSLEQLRAVGIEPERFQAIIAKGVVSPRAGYEAIARDFLLVDTPGITAADLSLFRYARRPQPLWPLDPEIAGFTPTLVSI
jgi:microcystin degradation protein MlrC